MGANNEGYMIPVIAQRTTTCYYCKELIKPGEQRLTDTIKTKGKTENNNIPYIIRRHFHWEREDQDRSCFELYAGKRFEDIPEEDRKVRTNNPNGRPKELDLTSEQFKIRKNLLKRIRQQYQYYITDGRLDISSPKLLMEINEDDVRKAKKFTNNLKSLVQQLENVGGAPKVYRRLLN